MTTPEQAIAQMIAELNPKSFVRYVQHRAELLNWVQQQQQLLHTQSIPETLYCWHQQRLPQQCACGAPAVFQSFVQGYREFCSASCPAKSRAQSQRMRTQWQDAERLQQMLQRRAATCEQRYGHSNPACTPLVRQKIQRTCEQRYGAPTPLHSAEIQQKITERHMQQLGVPRPFCSAQVRAQAQATFVRNQGQSNQMQLARAAWRQQHGDVNPFQLPEIQEKSQNSMLERWGVTHAFQHAPLREKQSDTMQQQYGRPNWSQLHIPEHSWAILQDAHQLKNLLENHTVTEAAALLSVRPELIRNHHNRLGLDCIPRRLRSLQEQELADLLSRLGLTFQRNNTSICAPLQLDFVIPDHQLAIEIGGLYWHAEISGKKHRRYHQNKMLTCESQGIQLISIWSDEWQQQQQLVQSMLRQRLGLTQHRIGARQCRVQQLDNAQAREFLQQNHLQGAVNASVTLALMLDQQPVQLLSWGRPRYNRQAEWELLRVATQQHTQVAGGVSRLWQHFLRSHNPGSVVSYTDRRWFTGGLYQQLGFTRSKTGTPTCWYTDYHQRWHRSHFTKQKLVQQGADASSTEWQIQQQLGFDRIWDCGQDTWIWQA